MKLNLENFQRVKDAIMAEPWNLHMRSFHCGTTHCIAGWAQVLAGVERLEAWATKKVIWDACEFLGIDQSGSDRNISLFYIDRWPKALSEAYNRVGNTPKDRAIVACEAIDWFIAEYGDKE